MKLLLIRERKEKMKEIYRMTKEEILQHQHVSEKGLTEGRVQEIRQKIGENQLQATKKKKSGAHFCGAVSGFAGYYFNDCRSCVDVIRKCGEYGCNLCCYCDECCAWNGSISQGRKIT